MTTYWIKDKAGRTAPTKDDVRITGYHCLINDTYYKFVDNYRKTQCNDALLHIIFLGFPQGSSRNRRRSTKRVAQWFFDRTTYYF